MEVLVEYDYQAQNPDELSIKKGDRIRNVLRKEEGWYEGEMLSTGRRGVFPDNFVKPVKASQMKPNIGFNTSGLTREENIGSQTISSAVPSNKKKNTGAAINNPLSNTMPTSGSAHQLHNNNGGKFQQQSQSHSQSQSPPPAPPPSTIAPLVANNYTPAQPPPQQQQHNNKLNNNNLNNSNSSPPPPPPPPPPVAKPNEYFNARVLYTYIPVNTDELPIQENDVVQVIRLIEDGWYEGLYNGKRGVFPSNYVEKINSDNQLNTSTNNLSNESINNNSISENIEETKSSGNKKNKRVMGIGFGNIFSGKQIELKTKENFNTNSNSSSNSSSNISGGIKTPTSPPPASSVLNRVAAVNNMTSTSSASTATTATTVVEKPTTPVPTRIKARVLYDYEPTQPDELKLSIGELVYIIDKNLEDEGWWRGESIATGKIGVFPDNFVEQLTDNTPVAANHAAAMNGITKRGKPQQQQVLTTQSPSVKNVINDFNLISSSSSPSSSSSTSSSTNSSNNSLSTSVNKRGDHHIQTNSHSNTTINNNNISNSTISSISNNMKQQSSNHFQSPPPQQQQHQQLQQISSSIEDNNAHNKSQSQSDLSEDLEDMQPHTDLNKLTHIKKTRQFNKRPPSFRSKNLSRNDVDEDEFQHQNMQQQQRNNNKYQQSISNGYSTPTKESSATSSQSSMQMKSPSFHQTQSEHVSGSDIMPLSPKSPVRSNSVHSATSMIQHLNGVGSANSQSNGNLQQQQQQQQQISTLMEELQMMRQELDTVKKNAHKSQADLKASFENELNETKRTHDDQIKKMQKNLQELINEIDDEKKTRLALQVELERLKKTVMNS